MTGCRRRQLPSFATTVSFPQLIINVLLNSTADLTEASTHAFYLQQDPMRDCTAACNVFNELSLAPGLRSMIVCWWPLINCHSKEGKKSRAPGEGKQGSNVFPTINFWLNTLFLLYVEKKDRIRGELCVWFACLPLLGIFSCSKGFWLFLSLLWSSAKVPTLHWMFSDVLMASQQSGVWKHLMVSSTPQLYHPHLLSHRHASSHSTIPQQGIRPTV